MALPLRYVETVQYTRESVRVGFPRLASYTPRDIQAPVLKRNPLRRCWAVVAVEVVPGQLSSIRDI